MKKIRLALLTITLLSLGFGYAFRSMLVQKIDEHAVLKEMYPEAVYTVEGGNPRHYRSDDGSIAFNSYGVAPGIRGYAGPIKVMLVLDPAGRIKSIKLLEHRETKNYVHYMEMPAYLSRFLGKSVTDPFLVDKDIDAITRATVSVEALAKTVKESSRTMAAGILGVKIQADDKKEAVSQKWIWFPILFVLSLSAYYITRRSKKFIRLRDISLIAGIAITGFLLSSPFSILHVFNLLLLRPSSAILWYVVVISTLLSVIVAGRFYCGWLCPFGALSEFLGRLPFRKWNIPAPVEGKWRKVKYLLLGLAAVLVLVSGRPDYGNFEPSITLFSFHGNPFAWSLLAITLIANIRVKRFWCRCLCPVAALTGALSRNAPGHPGARDCPMANRQNPESSECIRCNRCYSRK